MQPLRLIRFDSLDAFGRIAYLWNEHRETAFGRRAWRKCPGVNQQLNSGGDLCILGTIHGDHHGNKHLITAR